MRSRIAANNVRGTVARLRGPVSVAFASRIIARALATRRVVGLKIAEESPVTCSMSNGVYSFRQSLWTTRPIV